MKVFAFVVNTTNHNQQQHTTKPNTLNNIPPHTHTHFTPHANRPTLHNKHAHTLPTNDLRTLGDRTDSLLDKLYNRIIDNLAILPIAKSCRPMLQYSHDENNKRKSRKAGRETNYEKAAEPEEHERNYCELFR